MLWKDLLTYLKRDDFGETLEDTGFISYTIRNGYVIEFQTTRDDQWYKATYVQQIAIPEDGSTEVDLVVQLEGLPEDPFSMPLAPDTEYPVRIYSRIR